MAGGVAALVNEGAGAGAGAGAGVTAGLSAAAVEGVAAAALMGRGTIQEPHVASAAPFFASQHAHFHMPPLAPAPEAAAVDAVVLAEAAAVLAAAA